MADNRRRSGFSSGVVRSTTTIIRAYLSTSIPAKLSVIAASGSVCSGKCEQSQIRPRRLTNAARLSLVFWSRFFAGNFAHIVVKLATLIGWHPQGVLTVLEAKVEVGRRPIPLRLRQLIEHMVGENPILGEERIANWSARLELCQWRRETLDKESTWHEGRNTRLNTW